MFWNNDLVKFVFFEIRIFGFFWVTYHQKIANSGIYINFKDDAPEFVTIKVSGIRKGRKDRRFPIFSAEEAEKNNQFWDSWKK